VQLFSAKLQRPHNTTNHLSLLAYVFI